MLVHDLNSGRSIVVKYLMSNPETEGSNPIATLCEKMAKIKTFVQDLTSDCSTVAKHSTYDPEIDGMNPPPAQHQEHAEEKHLFVTRSVAVAQWLKST
jgi:hypothetical protein